MLQSLIVETEQVVGKEDILRDACMEGLEKSDDIMGRRMGDCEANSDKMGGENGPFTSTEQLQNQNYEAGTGSNIEYKNLVNHLHHLDAAAIEESLK